MLQAAILVALRARNETVVVVEGPRGRWRLKEAANCGGLTHVSMLSAEPISIRPASASAPAMQPWSFETWFQLMLAMRTVLFSTGVEAKATTAEMP